MVLCTGNKAKPADSYWIPGVPPADGWLGRGVVLRGVTSFSREYLQPQLFSGPCVRRKSFKSVGSWSSAVSEALLLLAQMGEAPMLGVLPCFISLILKGMQKSTGPL